jgi:NhaP-type Na+/H+ or K+/H+ antiporter
MPELSLGIELLLIALMVALVTKHTRRPYTIALVIWGLILGLLQMIEPFHLSKELVMVFFLPPLLFEGALHIRSTILRKQVGLVLGLALIGILITAVVVGLGVHLILGFDLLTALLLGVIVAPTDPTHSFQHLTQQGIQLLSLDITDNLHVLTCYTRNRGDCLLDHYRKRNSDGTKR